MSHAHLHARARVTTAVVVLGLQLVGAVHLALSAHGVDDGGRLVELHEFVEVHSHEGASLCDASADEATDDGPECGAADELTWQPLASNPSWAPACGPREPLPVDRLSLTPARWWLIAPKGSPPANA